MKLRPPSGLRHAARPSRPLNPPLPAPPLSQALTLRLSIRRVPPNFTATAMRQSPVRAATGVRSSALTIST